MFRLKSNALQREFKVNEGYLYASRIRNTRSGMDLVPDGNSTEFTFHFTDGTEFSSKGLKVTDSAERDGKLVFTFEEFEGITVTMRYWVGRDGNTLKKQLQFIQATEDKVIDYIANGEAMRGLCDIVTAAGATLVGIGCAVEKGFQGGGDRLRAAGVNLKSLAIIESAEPGHIVFRDED